MGVGQRGLALSTRLSSRVTVREVAAADADIDAVTEIIDTQVPEGAGEVPRGDHATLVLYAVLDGPSAAKIKIYGHCDDELGESSSSPDAGDEWALYGAELDVTSDNLMTVLVDMPANEYKVMVTSVTGTGNVIIREQHSA